MPRTSARSFVASAVAALVLLLCAPVQAQWPAKCDGDKECVGHALTISVTSGKVAQYVDVDPSTDLENFDTALTFEAWILPSPQPGKTQYIAGLWGPNRDNNDQWVLYIQDTKITFALSKDNSFKGDSDNTIATATIPDLYTNGWRHVAAVWDAKSTAARLYVDGVLQNVATNALYPLTKLHPPENKVLGLQIGSCNALYDDTLHRRAFLGQIDEAQLWSRALSDYEISCQHLVSLEGNEPGLELYYRCNDAQFPAYLCDATGRNHLGLMRSGARCDTSLREVPVTYSALPAALDTSLTCTQDVTFTFTLTDTSLCGDKVTLALYGPDQKAFTLSTPTLSLAQNVPATFTVHFHTDLIGTLNATVGIANVNNCGALLNIPLTVIRKTELQYSIGKLALDTLYVGCQNTTYSEKTVTICNPGPRIVRLDRVSLDSNHFTWQSAGLTFPKFLQPNDCVTITVRMDMLDSTKTLLDTLRIFSDEACTGSGVIPIYGRVQDVLGVLQNDGKTALKTVNLGEVCPGMTSPAANFQYRALGSDTVYVDSIIFSPPNFFGFGFALPMKLIPKRANQPTYIRFKPDHPGPFMGTLRVVSNYHGCTIVKTVALIGRGYSVDVDFLTPNIFFGNVTIGKTAQQSTTVVDSGADPRAIDSYLRVGDVFTITGGRSIKLNPLQTAPITLQFRPRQSQTYYDTLCIFDEGCYETKCMPVEGTGVFDAFQFDPPYLDLANVIGCQSGSGAITMKNVSGSSVTLTGATITDPTGKFTVKNYPSNGSFGNGQTFTFDITYTPNDVLNDRADEAYIDITLSDGQVYHILIRGSSVAPRLYVTPATTFGVVEVGWTRQDSILIENASSVSQKITGVTIPAGYLLTSTNPILPTVLAPRDSLWLHVTFQPTAEQDYNGIFTVAIDSPCAQTYSGSLNGHGRIVKLQVPISFMNYGLVRPCDCAEREIPLPNYSNLTPITIDSIWLEGPGVTPLTPSTFHWKRKSNGSQLLPLVIAPQTSDTLVVSFCPDIPATKANLVKNDTLRIHASTPGWSNTFTTLLSGRREMNFQPNVSLVQFPATRVDTSAQPQNVSISVPDILINPDGDSIIIDNVSFQPDQHVFSATESTGKPLPWIVKRNQKGFAIKVNFFPRAPKVYTARMLIHTTFPCNSTDTSVLVMGSGFAPAFGLQMAFDTSKIGRDTIRLTTCDTLVLPIWSNRDVPQKYMDVFFHLGFDTTELQMLGGSSTYTNEVNTSDTADGSDIIVRNGIDVKAGVITILKLKVIGGPDTLPITLDNINFDSDSLVFFKIIAGLDHGTIIIDEPKISMTKITNYDTVNVKTCKDEIVTVYNTGSIPVRFDSLSGLPKWHRVTASSKPLPDSIMPGDSIKLTVTFCPLDSAVFDTTLLAYSNLPCLTLDSGSLHSFGYAPPYPFKLSLTPDLASIDSIGGRIADTIEVPIQIDRDIPLTPLDVRFTLNYNPRALRYLSMSSNYVKPQVVDHTGTLDLALPECQNVAKGEIARAKFLITVPDSIVSLLTLTPGSFTSDSIMFIKPRPTGDTSYVKVGPRCNISRLVFRDGSNSISQPHPNPTSNRVAFDVSFVEDATPELQVLNSAGETVLTLMDGSRSYQGGSYHVEFDARQLPAGAYFVAFHAASYHTTTQLVIVK
jgi:hypothetical protein